MKYKRCGNPINSYNHDERYEKMVQLLRPTLQIAVMYGIVNSRNYGIIRTHEFHEHFQHFVFGQRYHTLSEKEGREKEKGGRGFILP